MAKKTCQVPLIFATDKEIDRANLGGARATKDYGARCAARGLLDRGAEPAATETDGGLQNPYSSARSRPK